MAPPQGKPAGGRAPRRGRHPQNPEEDQVATRVPFAGELDNPDAGVLAAGVNLLRTAFVAAFTHSLEGSVSLEGVQEGES